MAEIFTIYQAKAAREIKGIIDLMEEYSIQKNLYANDNRMEKFIRRHDDTD